MYAICTMFEGDYHFGLGALANSLYHGGYRGVLFAGFRGDLPPWAKQNEDGYLRIGEDFRIRFVRLATTVHFTNYKPDFMLSLWDSCCSSAEGLFYFDPDIVVRCRWTFFEEWISSGVALCVDVCGDMPDAHPIRNAWRRYYSQFGVQFRQKQNRYFNGGFIGVSKA